MESTSPFMLTIGGILLLGLITSAIGRKTFLPRVTLLLIFGAMIGSNGLDWIPLEISRRFELVANVALLMVGFLLGEKLAFKSVRQFAAPILWISLSAAVVTASVVSLGLMWVGVPKSIAVVLGCIAAATAPAAVLDVAMESGADGPFRNLLLAIVAIDDAWALLLFGFGVAIATAATETNAFMMVLREIGGGVALGLLLGLPAAYLTGRLRQGQPILLSLIHI